MLVRDVLQGKGDSTVVTVPETTTIEALLRALAEHNIGAVLVVSDSGVVGIASERDVVRALDSSGPGVLHAPVSEVMTRELTTAGPQESVDHVMKVMTNHRIRHLPILVDGELHGIISIGDIVKSRMGELESEREHLISYIGSGG